jgi:wyosine [tRNA(Phe)-imidazoG37] synthetase (radical SAM superfamily)
MGEYEKTGNLVEEIRSRPKKDLQKAALKILINNPLFDVEASSACNINCSFCPRTKLARKQTIMWPEIFAYVLKFLPQNAVVMFAGFGEPLLNKNLEIYIRQLKDRNISSCIITNGILLASERQK